MADHIVSITISQEDLAKVLDAVKSIELTLKPYLISLTPAQLMELPKMSDKTAPFVAKCAIMSRPMRNLPHLIQILKR